MRGTPVEVFEALYTTRAMRRMETDPIPQEVEAQILDAAIRAPSGGDRQPWRFVLVDEPDLKGQLGAIYRDVIADLWEDNYAEALERARANPDDPDNEQLLKMQRSAQHLADHFEEVPLLLFAFVRYDMSRGGSIFPAVWNAMLAARAQGVGSALTTVLIRREEDVQRLIGVPSDKGWKMACCVAFGYPRGRWGVAARQPVHEVSFRNGWDGNLGYEIPEPMWTYDE